MEATAGARQTSCLPGSEEQQHEEDIKKLQQHEAQQDARIDKLAEAVQQLAFALQHDRDMSARDRENLLLRLENALLRFERRLPPPGNISKDEEPGE